jgi:hypothetical protein
MNPDFQYGESRMFSRIDDFLALGIPAAGVERGAFA